MYIGFPSAEAVARVLGHYVIVVAIERRYRVGIPFSVGYLRYIGNKSIYDYRYIFD